MDSSGDTRTADQLTEVSYARLQEFSKTSSTYDFSTNEFTTWSSVQADALARHWAQGKVSDCRDNVQTLVDQLKILCSDTAGIVETVAIYEHALHRAGQLLKERDVAIEELKTKLKDVEATTWTRIENARKKFSAWIHQTWTARMRVLSTDLVAILSATFSDQQYSVTSQEIQESSVEWEKEVVQEMETIFSETRTNAPSGEPNSSAP
ncbi:hypothetical protein EXIGLDRAFT_703795 [Exidia glandulosa HHB12029]|uniref:Uncharacterized protein n=1 Tax=Exidia glandulosa HHB12029 TaxID=1314781 RepID=A0A165BYF8_EXIGL|nr:hypothetical protein EXIGLDRAFT_703795 [Exidia glandulosa HHB12029]